MARENTSILDGLQVGYGTRDTHNVEDATVHTYGRVKQVELRIDASTIAGLADGLAATSKSHVIPAGSKIVKSDYSVLEVFDGTDLIIGLKEVDGTQEDPNGLHTVEIDAVLLAGATFEGNGALINADVLDADMVISADVGGAITTGEATLLVEYIEPVPSSEPPAVLVGIQGSL